MAVNLTDVRVTYHRNGVSGVGFCLVTFTHRGDRLMAVVFDEDDPDRDCYTAVLSVDNLYASASPLALHDPFEDVRKFRGDHFDGALLAAIRDATAAYDQAYDEKYGKAEA